MVRILLSILISLFICQDAHAQRVTSPPQRIRFGTTLPSTCTNGMLFQDTDATAGQQIYACESGAWVLQGDGGSGSVSDTAYAASWDGVTTTAPSKNAVYDKIETISGSGDSVTVNTTAATNANFLDNLYYDWALDTAATPDDITVKPNYNAASGDFAFLTNECAWAVNGLVCEGVTADTIEIFLQFPDPATTDKTITLPNATDTLVGKDTTDTLTNKTLAAASNVLDADTAVALAADPADCATSTHFAVGVIASGAATCEAIGDADVPNTITVDLATTATTANAGDSATSFFSSGTLEVAIGGTGTTTSTGTGAVVLGTSPTIATLIETGKTDRNNSAVDDDDCTGEQGLYWYDTTDSRFEFCDANSGTPTAISAASDTNAVKEYWWPASASLPLEVADSIPPISKDAGTNIDQLTVDFDDSTDECRTVSFKVPSDVTGGSTITFRWHWYSAAATSGNAIIEIRHNGGVAEGTDPDQTLTTVAAAADATQGTAGQLTATVWTETLANLGWGANEEVDAEFCRDANNASDTLVGDLKTKGFGVEIPRS